MGDVLFIAERWKWARCINYKVRYEEEGYMRKAAEKIPLQNLICIVTSRYDASKKKKTATAIVP